MRNDTGVFEGGEISMFYDPMIAKLCTWAPDRAAAIDGDAPRRSTRSRSRGSATTCRSCRRSWTIRASSSGEITTAFIAEEYPDGFAGAPLAGETLTDLAALAVVLKVLRRARARRGSRARWRTTSGRSATTGWCGSARRTWRGTVAADRAAFAVRFGDAARRLVTLDAAAAFGPLVRAEVDGAARIVKVAATPKGFRMRYRGADLQVDAC